jgi:hypothetical protein
MSGNGPAWFDDIPVLGSRPPAEAAQILREFGDADLASRLELQPSGEIKTFGIGTTVRGFWDDTFGPCLWRYSAHAFGYMAPHAPGATAPLPIQHAGNITPHTTLQGSQARITLNWLRVADYPGAGMHRVLFDFYARNQSQGPDAELHFNATYRVMEGQRAGIIGYPIFVGVNVGEQGLAFRCFTVNVKNDADEAFLDLLESDAFKQGLEITENGQPAIRPLAEMAYGLTRAAANRNRNVPVQDVYMGLDFSQVPGRARLAEGAYIAAQIPDALSTVWDWEAWVYDPRNGNIVSKDDLTKPLSYNYGSPGEIVGV